MARVIQDVKAMQDRRNELCQHYIIVIIVAVPETVVHRTTFLRVDEGDCSWKQRL